MQECDVHHRLSLHDGVRIELRPVGTHEVPRAQSSWRADLDGGPTDVFAECSRRLVVIQRPRRWQPLTLEGGSLQMHGYGCRRSPNRLLDRRCDHHAARNIRHAHGSRSSRVRGNGNGVFQAEPLPEPIVLTRTATAGPRGFLYGPNCRTAYRTSASRVSTMREFPPPSRASVAPLPDGCSSAVGRPRGPSGRHYTRGGRAWSNAARDSTRTFRLASRLAAGGDERTTQRWAPGYQFNRRNSAASLSSASTLGDDGRASGHASSAFGAEATERLKAPQRSGHGDYRATRPASGPTVQRSCMRCGIQSRHTWHGSLTSGVGS